MPPGLSLRPVQGQGLGREHSLRLSDLGYVTSDGLGNRQSSGPTEMIRQGSGGANVQPDEGTGPGAAGDRYDRIVENAFVHVTDHPLSTFSIDVDTAAYSIVRSHLLSRQTMPPPDAVRIEELVNYFAYQYEGPQDDVPFAANIEVAGCPWKAEHRLVRVALKGKEMDVGARPLSNLVFLIDVSGSMNQPNKLPLLKRGMKLLAEQLGENDRVAIVVYASAQGLALPSTSGLERQKILDALDSLQAGGSTNGGAGIELAYKIAQDKFIEGGVNRVLLCTDGDFNVGTTSTAALERMVEDKAQSGVFLTVLGFGHGNLNDAMMENISNKGNGNYAYIDNLTEARKVLVQQMTGTLVTIAKDVKIQIEFNPRQVAAYRQIGYENRRLAAQDFNDDKKDAGEIGAGHSVTALYEIVPAGKDVMEKEVDIPGVDPLRYQTSGEPTEAAGSGEMLTLKVRYKQPDGEKSRKLEFPVKDAGKKFARASGDFQFASAVATFGMLLRGSQYAGDATFDAVLEIGKSSQGEGEQGDRAEFLEMVRQAKQLRP
ncbi:MAG: VWA domain-containing protein [Planctomycetota bacterium]|nr:VWA domain-containing protein [Planctomycetota bacterium]